MSARRDLPSRRALTRLETEFAGHAYTVDFATFEDGGAAEIFVNAAKTSSAAEAVARDAAIVLSISFQYGAPFEAMRRAMTRDGAGAPLSIVGHALDVVAQEIEAGS